MKTRLTKKKKKINRDFSKEINIFSKKAMNSSPFFMF